MTTLIRHLTLHSTTEPCMARCPLNHTCVITEPGKCRYLTPAVARVAPRGFRSAVVW
jgi:hypothetical protein